MNMDKSYSGGGGSGVTWHLPIVGSWINCTRVPTPQSGGAVLALSLKWWVLAQLFVKVHRSVESEVFKSSCHLL